MKLKLNIGLDTRSGKTLSQLDALHAVDDLLGVPIATRLAHSDSELTLVVEVETVGLAGFEAVESAIYLLAHKLDQHCIAWQDGEGEGHLTGSDLSGFGGAYDAEYFLPVVETPGKGGRAIQVLETLFPRAQAAKRYSVSDFRLIASVLFP